MSQDERESEHYSSDRTRYRLLLEMTDRLSREANLPEVFTDVAPPLLELTGGDLLHLSLRDPRGDYMATQYWKRNNESGVFDSIPVDQATSGWSWRHQSPLAIHDIEDDGRFAEIVPTLRAHGVRSYTAIPMSSASRHFGAIGIGKNIPGTLRFEDIELLSRIALLSALNLEKEKAGKAFEEQQSLVAISQQLSTNLELEKLLPVILQSLRSIARYERSVLSLLEKGDAHVYLHGEVLEWEPFINHGAKLPTAHSLSAKAINTRQVTFYGADDLRQAQLPIANAMLEAGVRSLCSVPLIASGRVWGALDISGTSNNAFSHAEVSYLQQVANQIATAVQNAHAFKEIEELKDRLSQEKHYLEYEIRSVNRSGDIVGSSQALKRVMDNAAVVADTDSTVLITGETGTGKEGVARLIHSMSQRKDRNFIKLNCAAIPTGLLESELFGHERGAFTGAISQKLGRLELADKGTLLLDEIGDIPLELQPKLLRVLQDQEFERLGGTKTIRVDVRVIAATNRDLARVVEEREFRSDLFYRLNVFPIHLPSLRERREDIPALIRHFVDKCAARMHKHIDVIPKEVLSATMRWMWPGNIRELENFIERSVILSEGTTLNAPLTELSEELMNSSPKAAGTLVDLEREHIIEILRQSHGTISGPQGAAARLGIKRTTLQYKMARLGISRNIYSESR